MAIYRPMDDKEAMFARPAYVLKGGVVIARDGTRVPIAFDTICVHADMERAVERLRAIRQRLGGME